MSEQEATGVAPLDEIDAMTANLTRLPIMSPPMFAAACGYAGEARYVAFYMDGAGGRCDLHFNDGLKSSRCDFLAWRIWSEHLTVFPALINYRFGPDEFGAQPAPHWLLVDRATGALYVGERKDVDGFLRNEVRDMLPRGPLVVEDINGEMLVAEPGDSEAMRRFSLALDRRLRAETQMQSEEVVGSRVRAIHERMAAEARFCEALREYLDAHITDEAVELYKSIIRSEYQRILKDIRDRSSSPASPANEG